MHSHKVCTRCKQNKPSSDYTTRKSARGAVSLQSRCRQCASEAAREHQNKKFQTKAEYNQHMAEYRRTASGSLSWFRTKAKRLGLDPEQVERAVASFLSNEGHCEVCGADPIAEGNKTGLCIDHCHETLTFRGLLCTSCNLMLGYGRDSTEVLRSGATYLENHRNPVTV